MSPRRTPAPDIVAGVLLLYAATFFFAVLKALFSTRTVTEALSRAAVYTGLLGLCIYLAVGLLRRRPSALPGTLLALLGCLIAAMSGFHVPETAQVPAGVLSLFGIVLLLFSRRELA
jgi:hypothetical protein